MILTSVELVFANEYPEITKDVEIRYKWYKEIITGEYYLFKDISSEDKIDKNKIRYGNYSEWKSNYCNLSPEHYEISTRKKYKYNKAENIKYILLENFEYKDNIKIYYENKPLEEVVEEIKLNSRRYAKRQFTFFKHQFNTKWFDVNFDDFNKTIEEVYNFIKTN